jgi:hypothetical protein
MVKNNLLFFNILPTFLASFKKTFYFYPNSFGLSKKTTASFLQSQKSQQSLQQGYYTLFALPKAYKNRRFL